MVAVVVAIGVAVAEEEGGVMVVESVQEEEVMVERVAMVKGEVMVVVESVQEEEAMVEMVTMAKKEW